MEISNKCHLKWINILILVYKIIIDIDFMEFQIVF
jgi:hypothetical protein